MWVCDICSNKFINYNSGLILRSKIKYTFYNYSTSRLVTLFQQTLPMSFSLRFSKLKRSYWIVSWKRSIKIFFMLTDKLSMLLSVLEGKNIYNKNTKIQRYTMVFIVKETTFHCLSDTLTLDNCGPHHLHSHIRCLVNDFLLSKEKKWANYNLRNIET